MDMDTHSANLIGLGRDADFLPDIPVAPVEARTPGTGQGSGEEHIRFDRSVKDDAGAKKEPRESDLSEDVFDADPDLEEKTGGATIF